MVDVPKKAADLSPEQRDRLFRHLREGRQAPRPGIPVREDRNAPVPLSFAQQRLWFMDQLIPGTAFYNIPVAVRIDGPLDVSALRAALGALASRHETLRTTFELRDEQAVQVIAPQSGPPLYFVDLSELPMEQAEPLARRIYRQQAREGFDLRRGPLLRTTLARYSPESHVLLLIFHHIISDLWSLGVFIRELTQIYSSLRHGRTPVLPALPIQYADFSVWQRQRLQGEVLQQEIAHWKEVLQGAPAYVELPVDRPRPPVMAFQGARVDWKLPSQTSRELKALGQAEEATLFMTLLAAYSLLLARYSFQKDLVIGSPVANRSRIEIEGLIGFFINMLVLRADLTRRPSFRELLGRVKERCIQAFNHQDVPFEQLVDELGIERNLSRPPLIQAALALQNVSIPSLEIDGLSFKTMKTDVGISKFDLTMEIFDQESGLQGSTEYNSELFEEVTAQRMSQHFAVLLEALSKEPGRSVWELPLLSEAERQQLFSEWQSRPEPREEETLTQLFRSTARRRPETPAMTWEGGELSYGGFSARSLRVAARLRDLEVGPEVLVALMLDPSPELLVALVGILEAGGACLLLGPDRERSWLEKSLEQSGVSVVLTQEKLRNRLPEHGAREALLEELLESPADGRDGLPGEVEPQALAFVVQTSGAHHAPRFVGLEHRSVAAWVRHWEKRLPAEPLKVAALSRLETVDGVFDLIVPLCLGGSVVLSTLPGSSLVSATPAQLSLQLRRGVTWQGTPAVRSFGQSVSRSLVERLEKAGVSRIYDSYSSALVGVWEWESRPGAGIDRQGRAYVLDETGEPAPIGVSGQLWLSGEGQARGYITDAEQTAASFVPDRFGDRPGNRLVRTGDLARWRRDGSLEASWEGSNGRSSYGGSAWIQAPSRRSWLAIRESCRPSQGFSRRTGRRTWWPMRCPSWGPRRPP